ncbi:hypothetical protein O9G_005642 [Rozella allomycis CSF55]|uniref:mRNA 5'-phosphatase n=1 Tax=Rozella allomycis (strain CSF55) TaxID=988480 RepID=A0A075AQR5_ROZAC|nr:hypothetical protein O9G_005642 [Rozella allomycis CSF55]|eukprot:EPZ32576.1 hypothetical protein O9G_005642 [Rozella allomycis CSF55]
MNDKKRARTDEELSPEPPKSPKKQGKRKVLYPLLKDYIPTNDLVLTVSDFLFHFMTIENIEIEAKIGHLIDNKTHQRIKPNVATDCGINNLFIQSSGYR